MKNKLSINKSSQYGNSERLLEILKNYENEWKGGSIRVPLRKRTLKERIIKFILNFIPPTDIFHV